MLPLSPFDIVNHLKFDQRTDIEYLHMSSQNHKVVNYKVLDLFELYSFGIKFCLEPASSYKKVMIFFTKQHIAASCSNISAVKVQTIMGDCDCTVTVGKSHEPIITHYHY